MEQIGRIKKNEAGQVFIEGIDGNAFDMSKYIGRNIYVTGMVRVEIVVRDKQGTVIPHRVESTKKGSA